MAYGNRVVAPKQEADGLLHAYPVLTGAIATVVIFRHRRLPHCFGLVAVYRGVEMAHDVAEKPSMHLLAAAQGPFTHHFSEKALDGELLMALLSLDAFKTQIIGDW